MTLLIFVSTSGSSPHMRGKLGIDTNHVREGRITPAIAGHSKYNGKAITPANNLEH